MVWIHSWSSYPVSDSPALFSCSVSHAVKGSGHTDTPFDTALLVLATYKELLLRIGLRRLVLLNLCCSGFGVFYSSLICISSPLCLLRSRIPTTLKLV